MRIGFGIGISSAARSGRRNMLPNSGTAGAMVGVVGSGGAAPTGWSLGVTLTREILGVGVTDGVPWFDVKLTGTLTGAYFLNFAANTATPAADGQTWNASIYAQAIGSVVGASGLTVQISSRLANSNSKFGYPGTTIGFPASFTRFTTPAATLLNSDGAAGNVAFVIGFLQLTCTGTVDVTLRLGGRQVEQGFIASPWQARP